MVIVIIVATLVGILAGWLTACVVLKTPILPLVRYERAVTLCSCGVCKSTYPAGEWHICPRGTSK